MTDLTAAEEILLAAANLTKNTTNEFNEWDLTVKTWELNKQRWGLKGYEDSYPNHKRVMNEVMAKGTQKTVGRGWLERTRPNHYRLTYLGLATASSMSGVKPTSEAKNMNVYEALRPYIFSTIFKSYCKDPNEPKTWLGVTAFLKLTDHSPDTLEKSLKYLTTSIDAALVFIDQTNSKVLRRDDAASPISKEQLLKLKEFLSVLDQRFKLQFEAIRGKKEA